MSVPHLAWPLRLDGDRFATLEQDSVDEIAQCVEILLSTEQGQRLEVPDYGVPSWLFTTGPDLGRIAGEIEEWEPRAVTLLDTEPDVLDELIRHVTVRTAARGD